MAAERCLKDNVDDCVSELIKCYDYDWKHSDVLEGIELMLFINKCYKYSGPSTMEPRKSISGRSIMDSHFEDTEGSFMKSSDSHEWNKSFDFFADKFVGKITEEDYKSLENCLRQRETKRNRVTQISQKVENEDKNRECECECDCFGFNKAEEDTYDEEEEEQQQQQKNSEEYENT